MNEQRKSTWVAPAIIGLVLLLAVAVLIFVRCSGPRPAGTTASASLSATPSATPSATFTAYVPGEYPPGVSMAEVVTGDSLGDAESYAAYDPDNDPAHPVLDVKVKLFISNLGSRPGVPRPQDIALEYPAQTLPPQATPKPTSTLTGTPTPTLQPIIRPGLKPNISLPPVSLPQLYLLQPSIASPQYAGSRYLLAWEYTADRKADFSVSLSLDGGGTFAELATGLKSRSFELTFPATPGEPVHCVLRVTALVAGRVYMSADTAEFVLASVQLLPAPIADYVDPQVRYVDMPGLRISSETGISVWFKAENGAQDADRLVWQLSGIPFWGTKEVFGSENGILATGEVSKAKGEFSVDLQAICEQLAKPNAERGTEQPFLPRQNVYQFYLRVVPLDAKGNCIGDPGRGLSFTYGAPEVDTGIASTAKAGDPKITVLMEMPVPYTSYSYQWKRICPDVYHTDLGNVSDRVLFGCGDDQKTSELICRAVRVELQVATSPFANATVGVAQPDGLVYSYLDTAPDITESADGYGYITPWNHGLEYKQFVPAKEQLDALGGIYYYVRGLFYVPDSENPSILLPYPSETLTIALRSTASGKNEVKRVTVESCIPYVQFLGYQPIQWQDPNYDEYFEVTRHIEAEEMNFTIRNTKTGDFLLPYQAHIAKYGWTREQYQAKLDEMLPQYASFHYVKSEPGFWDEFFGLLRAIYTGVSKAYADTKAAVVSLVDDIPLIGDEARGYLKKAVTYAIDYGLVSIGLPPSLPNLDLLAADGMDYLVKLGIDEALQAAGIPPDSPAAAEITDQVRKQVTDGLTDELAKAILSQQQNPFHADFLRVSRSMLYRPAYVAVFVKNYSNVHTTPAGKLSFRSGTGFDVYETRVVSLPPLKPGEGTTVYLYLDHLRNQYDGYGKYFDEKYNGQGTEPYKMTVSAYFELPDVRQAAKDQGLGPAPLPYVTEYVYDHTGYVYEREFVPAEGFWQPDPAADAAAFQN